MLWIWLAPILFKTVVEPPLPGMVTLLTTEGIVTVVWGVAAVLAVTAGAFELAPAALAALLIALEAVLAARLLAAAAGLEGALPAGGGAVVAGGGGGAGGAGV